MEVRIGKLTGNETFGKVDHENHVELFMFDGTDKLTTPPLLYVKLDDGVAWRLYRKLSDHFAGRSSPEDEAMAINQLGGVP